MPNSFLIFGREPSLSFAEAYEHLGRRESAIEAAGTQGIIVSEGSLGAEAPNLLGGTPKAGHAIARMRALDADALAALFQNEVRPGSKFHFGLSSYALGGTPISERERKALGLSIKKRLKSAGHSVRLVESKSGNLSSVDVVKNGLLKKGAEFCLLRTREEYVVGKTASVQPFEEYGERDYGRPGRDMLRGMLPPKLARMLVNLSGAQAGQTILDPFCGTGTVLQEALLMGIGVVGTDIDEKAIRDSEQNVKWLKERHELPDYRITEMDVRKLDSVIASQSIDAVVTECDLGPAMTGRESSRDVERVERELSDLYGAALDLIHFALKPRGRAVLAWPYFKEHNIWISAFDGIAGRGFGIIEPYPAQYRPTYPLSKRATLLYGREGQHVFREIILLEKK